MSWIILAIGVIAWTSLFCQFFMYTAMLHAGHLKSLEVPAFQLIWRSILIVLPFYLDHWPTFGGF